MVTSLELYLARIYLTLKSKSVTEVPVSCCFSLHSEADIQSSSYLSGRSSKGRLVKSFGNKAFFGKASAFVMV